MIATVTHARLRAAQGDLAAARRILREVLRESPHHREALQLLSQFEGRADSAVTEAPREILRPPEAADARSLTEAFRRTLKPADGPARPEVERLRTWLRRISDRSR